MSGKMFAIGYLLLIASFISAGYGAINDVSYLYMIPVVIAAAMSMLVMFRRTK